MALVIAVVETLKGCSVHSWCCNARAHVTVLIVVDGIGLTLKKVFDGVLVA
jgi:hypothetical protein